MRSLTAAVIRRTRQPLRLHDGKCSFVVIIVRPRSHGVPSAQVRSLCDQHMRTHIIDNLPERLHRLRRVMERLIWEIKDPYIRHPEKRADLTKLILFESRVIISTLVDNLRILLRLRLEQLVMEPFVVRTDPVGHTDNCDGIPLRQRERHKCQHSA